MEADRLDDSLEQATQVVAERFTLWEREAARDLIQDAFYLLPWELQDLYLGVVELYRQGKLGESAKLFEEWLDQARELDLI